MSEKAKWTCKSNGVQLVSCLLDTTDSPSWLLQRILFITRNVQSFSCSAEFGKKRILGLTYELTFSSSKSK
ncbi:hypothetical protein SRHO_G00227760 [Serrasalmus rhombeus]